MIQLTALPEVPNLCPLTIVIFHEKIEIYAYFSAAERSTSPFRGHNSDPKYEARPIQSTSAQITQNPMQNNYNAV